MWTWLEVCFSHQTHHAPIEETSESDPALSLGLLLVQATISNRFSNVQ